MGSDSKAVLSSSFLPPLQLGACEWTAALHFPSRAQSSVKCRKVCKLKSCSMTMSQGNRNEIFQSFPEPDFPQNMDLPPVLSTRRKRPYVRPIKLVIRESRRLRKLGMLQGGYFDPPRNGMLVEHLIPLAHQVMKELSVLHQGVAKLMEVIPVQACSCCDNVHIGVTGHLMRTCKGAGCNSRGGRHVWIKGYVPDVLIPVESYHVLNRLAPSVHHDQRFSVPRLCAITALCIQAGYEHPNYPVVRWATASGRQVGSGRPEVKHLGLLKSYVDESADQYTFPPLVDDEPDPEDDVVDAVVATAERTLRAFQNVRKGVQMLMKSHRVRACGYCPEVHVGPKGHRVKFCGAFKHQQRNGFHGWQEAALSDILPPNFVWHVPVGKSPAMPNETRSYYGQAPAVVELCVQAGAGIPPKWKPFMRTDVVIPDVYEGAFVY